jgi:hypothetical protein
LRRSRAGLTFKRSAGFEVTASIAHILAPHAFTQRLATFESAAGVKRNAVFAHIQIRVAFWTSRLKCDVKLRGWQDSPTSGTTHYFMKPGHDGRTELGSVELGTTVAKFLFIPLAIAVTIHIAVLTVFSIQVRLLCDDED